MVQIAYYNLTHLSHCIITHYSNLSHCILKLTNWVNQKEMEILGIKLNTCLIDGHYVFDTVARALLSCIRTEVIVNRQRPSVFMLLGLTTAGKADLLKDLTKLLLVENGTTSWTVQINSSECTHFDKFFNLMYVRTLQYCFCTCLFHLWLWELTQLFIFFISYTNHKPVGVLLVDEVEKAPMPLVSALIEMMDRGILSDHRGCTVDFKYSNQSLSLKERCRQFWNSQSKLLARVFETGISSGSNYMEYNFFKVFVKST